MRKRAPSVRAVRLATAVALLFVNSACGDDDDDADPTTTTLSAFALAVARVNESLALFPSNIASNINGLGLAHVTAEQVDSVASELCISGYDSSVTIEWIRENVSVVSSMLVGSGNRILGLASKNCLVKATAQQTSDYSAQLWNEFAAGSLPQLSETLPSAGERAICDVVGSHAGGQAVEGLLGALIDFASRGRIEPDLMLPVVAEVVGGTCSQWLPSVNDALDQYFG
jgi:hypothetical protein